MATVIINLLKDRFTRSRPVFKVDAEIEYARIMMDADGYDKVSVQEERTGEAAAEEMFALTNDPSRQDEREVRYGRGRSVSTGDVVTVDGVNYLCVSIGWQVI